MNALFDPLATRRTACPEAQALSADWMRDVSMVLSLGTPSVATARLAVSVVQAGGMVGCAGRFESPAPHALGSVDVDVAPLLVVPCEVDEVPLALPLPERADEPDALEPDDPRPLAEE